MRIARVVTPSGPKPCVAEGDDWVVVEDAFARSLVPTGERAPQAGAHLLAPVQPLVVLGMLHNTGPEDALLPPQAFLKSPRTVVAPGEQIVVDSRLGHVRGEAELVAVIGRPCRDVEAADAADYVLGWTIGNDVTAVDQAVLDETRTQAKNGDGFTPLGPWIETDLDPLAVGLTASVDGREAARGSTADLARDAYRTIAFASRYLSLGPGDVILTGAPGTAFDLAPGQEASVAVEGIGVLTNPSRALAR